MARSAAIVLLADGCRLRDDVIPATKVGELVIVRRTSVVVVATVLPAVSASVITQPSNGCVSGFNVPLLSRALPETLPLIETKGYRPKFGP